MVSPTDITFGEEDDLPSQDRTLMHGGLTNQYHLDGDATDSIGGNDGTLNGSPTTVTGRDGDALRFDEVDDYVSVPDVAMNDEFTVSFQFKIDDTTGSLFQYIYSHGDVNSTNSLNIFINESSHGTHPNVLRTVMRDTNDALDNAGLEFDISSIVGDGNWHTYTLVVNSSGSTVYLDGVQQNTSTAGGDSFDPSGNLILGARHDLNSARMYGGDLDTVQVYDRPLTSTEVDDLHSLTAPSYAMGMPVARVTDIIDVDDASGHSFALTDDAGGLFQIDPGTGVISLASDIDASTVFTDEITVEVTDPSLNTYSETLGVAFGTDGAGDTISGPHSQNIIYGLGGNDDLSGGSGNDILVGGDGNDTVSGGAGSDRMLGGAGADDLTGGSGDDFIDGGAGADTLSGGSAADVLYGSSGGDSLSGGDGNDILTGDNSSEELITNGDFSSGLTGWTINNPTGGAPIYAGGLDAGFNGSDEAVYGDSMQQDVDAPVGVSHTVSLDLIERDVGNAAHTFRIDILDDSGSVIATETHTVANNTTLPVSFTFIPTSTTSTLLITNTTSTGTISTDGRVDNISITATDTGIGNDTLTGGAGDDVFVYNTGTGDDTITDFNTGNTGTLSDGDNTNNDFIDLSSYYDDIWELHADQADDGILNQSNDGVDGANFSDNTQFGAGDSLTFTGASADGSSFTVENTGVICFTSGTAIRTPHGDVLIDDLRVGDLVTTMDNGPQPICWISKRSFNRAQLLRAPNLRPVLIKKEVLSAERDLVVSPQHGMLLGRKGDYLARAKHLVEATPGVRICNGKSKVTYIHLMFDAHQIIFAENTPSESFYPGPMGLSTLTDSARRGLFSIFPKLAPITATRDRISQSYGGTVRPFLCARNIPGELEGLAPQSETRSVNRV